MTNGSSGAAWRTTTITCSVFSQLDEPLVSAGLCWSLLTGRTFDCAAPTGTSRLSRRGTYKSSDLQKQTQPRQQKQKSKTKKKKEEDCLQISDTCIENCVTSSTFICQKKSCISRRLNMNRSRHLHGNQRQQKSEVAFCFFFFFFVVVVVVVENESAN